jgi:hypothetical protein
MRTARTVAPALIGLLLTMGGLSTPTAAATPTSVVDNETQPIYSYADAIARPSSSSPQWTLTTTAGEIVSPRM